MRSRFQVEKSDRSIEPRYNVPVGRENMKRLSWFGCRRLGDRKSNMVRAQSEVTLIAPRRHQRRDRAADSGLRKEDRNQGQAHLRLGPRNQETGGERRGLRCAHRPAALSRKFSRRATWWPSSAKTLASISIGVAVKKGTPKPDISTPEAVKKMLLAAKSVGYPNPSGGAAAGVAFDATLKQLGIAEQMEPKLKRAQGGAGAMTHGRQWRSRNRPDVHERDGKSRHRYRRPAAEGNCSAHDPGRVRFSARQGSRGREEAAGLSFVA